MTQNPHYQGSLSAFAAWTTAATLKQKNTSHTNTDWSKRNLVNLMAGDFPGMKINLSCHEMIKCQEKKKDIFLKNLAFSLKAALLPLCFVLFRKDEKRDKTLSTTSFSGLTFLMKKTAAASFIRPPVLQQEGPTQSGPSLVESLVFVWPPPSLVPREMCLQFMLGFWKNG